MAKATKYVSKQPDINGFIDYTSEEHGTWEILYNRQLDILHDRACPEFLAGIDALDLNAKEIPQLPIMNEKLKAITGWQVQAVPALIGFAQFFELLADKKFPAATFIRTRADLDYIQEPDIFHEFFGHCPLLTNPDYAEFSQHYGRLGLAANKADRRMLARLYWFTIEFGLIETAKGLRIYGGGILSSTEESHYSLESIQPVRKDLDVIDAFRTYYRIDQLQRTYFKIKDFADLKRIREMDLDKLIKEARYLGMHKSLYQPKEDAAC
ncbi:MAG: phenylalanine 4-monooxygenase [Algicola sp.]|nr:phenylalanine 4-monooxygenase [Algicola sp.]